MSGRRRPRAAVHAAFRSGAPQSQAFSRGGEVKHASRLTGVQLLSTGGNNCYPVVTPAGSISR